jgi:hypothetical protein
MDGMEWLQIAITNRIEKEVQEKPVRLRLSVPP